MRLTSKQIFILGSNTILLIGALLFSSCHTGTTTKSTCNTFNGNWELVQYFDSISVNKTIAKFRLQEPTWYAILLRIEDESIYSNGSIYDLKGKIDQCADTIWKFNDYDEGSWSLQRKDSFLILNKYKSSGFPDTIAYVYQPSKTIPDRLVERIIGFRDLSLIVTNHFNRSILSGKYKQKQNKKPIRFLPYGHVIGLNNYSKYEINDYFGTHHPFNNLDMVVLSDEKGNSDYFHWQFNGNKLTLTMFKRNTKGLAEDFILSGYKIELIKD